MPRNIHQCLRQDRSSYYIKIDQLRLSSNSNCRKQFQTYTPPRSFLRFIRSNAECTWIIFSMVDCLQTPHVKRRATVIGNGEIFFNESWLRILIKFLEDISDGVYYH